jgi:broad specificity phosphatase PhoE
MIYFVRHGETEYNVLNLMQGHMDIPLNENGINQAKIAREELKDLKIDEIYSSPLIRAYKTAEIIKKSKFVPCAKS